MKDDFDYRCPMFSVVTNLKHGVDDIPPPPHIKVEQSGRALPNTIGIAWSGNRAHGRDKHRSIDVDRFVKLLDHNRRALYSVQDGEFYEAVSCGVITRPYQDFADTASWMTRFDHIVSVDSAPAHLAGSIGHPSVHVMVPYSSDWRWYNAQAWYPGVKVHRQDRPGDWESAFVKVNRCLNAT